MQRGRRRRPRRMRRARRSTATCRSCSGMRCIKSTAPSGLPTRPRPRLPVVIPAQAATRAPCTPARRPHHRPRLRNRRSRLPLPRLLLALRPPLPAARPQVRRRRVRSRSRRLPQRREASRVDAVREALTLQLVTRRTRASRRCVYAQIRRVGMRAMRIEGRTLSRSQPSYRSTCTAVTHSALDSARLRCSVHRACECFTSYRDYLLFAYCSELRCTAGSQPVPSRLNI